MKTGQRLIFYTGTHEERELNHHTAANRQRFTNISLKNLQLLEVD